MRVRSTIVLGVFVSFLMHGSALGALFNKAPSSSKVENKRRSVKVSLRRPKPPPPKPPPEPPPPPPKVVEPEPEPKPEPKPKPKPKPRKKAKVLRAKKVKKLSPPKPEAQPEPEVKPPPAPRKFAVNLEGTVSTGGIAVPTMEGGSSLVADASRAGEEEPGEEVEKPVKAAEVTEVTRMPRVLRSPSDDELRSRYPEEARRLGLEGDVRLELLVSAEGRVIRTRILRKAGNGFDEAARKLVKLFRFRPAMQGDTPVAVWIPWTYKFRLDL